jgi:hypothetical protein
LRRRPRWAIFSDATGAEFIRRLRRLARQRRIPFDMNTRRGRGSHRIVYFGIRWTTVKDLEEEVGKGLLRQMCKDLGVDPAELS